MITLVFLATVLTADVDYNFRDKNGVGWVMSDGKVTITLTFTKDGGTLAIKGKRRTVDAQLVPGKDPKATPDVKTREWEGDVDESYPLYDVVRTGNTFTFKVDPLHDKLTGTCAPTTVAQIASKTLFECTLDGFRWRPAASLPELHHPIVLESNPRTKHRVLDTFTGATRRQFGQRTVSVVKPPKPKKP